MTIRTVTMTGFVDAIRGEAGYFIAALIIVAALFAAAVLAERAGKKKEGNRGEEISRTKKIALIGMFSALAGVLMLLEIPLPFVPEFYKIDLSEIPVIVCSFMLGPVAGVATEFIKIVVKTLLKPTSTVYVGEVANFVVGCAFVIPATIVYRWKKTKKTALIALITGTLSMALMGGLMNAFVLLPAFAYLYGGMPVSALIQMGTAVNPAITSMLTFILWAVVPLNLIKGILISIITLLIYKKISRVIKGKI